MAIVTSNIEIYLTDGTVFKFNGREIDLNDDYLSIEDQDGRIHSFPYVAIDYHTNYDTLAEMSRWEETLG